MSFTLNQTIDTTQSVYLNYSNMILNNIVTYDNTSVTANEVSIKADVLQSGTSSLTYTTSGVSYEFDAVSIEIIGVGGENPGSNIPQITDLTTTQIGQLIITHTTTNGNWSGGNFLMCFPLFVTSDSALQNDLDLVFQATIPYLSSSNSPIVGGSATIDIQKTLNEQTNNETKYIIFDDGNNKVCIFGQEYFIISAGAYALPKIYTNIYNANTNYDVILSTQPGQWMECDYVDVDSDNVAVTVSSGIVQDNSAYNSLRTMMMYILFIIFTGLSYTIIPWIYIIMLKGFFTFTEATTEQAQTKQMGKLDFGLFAFLTGVTILFMGIGIFSDSSASPLLLLYGVFLGIAILLGNIIIKSKKSSDPRWPIQEIQKDLS